MITKVIFAIGLGLGAIILVWYLSNRDVIDVNLNFETNIDRPSGGGSVVGDSSGGVTHLPGTVASYENNPPTDSPVVDNKDANELSEDFYKLSGDDSLYGVYYDEPSGSFTITLYSEDTKKARQSAETYILKNLSYTKDQWCRFPVTVITNEYENPQWAGVNLGLSFCPGSVQL